MKTILLVGGRTPVALELARQLHRAGARVVASDVYPATLCGRSNCVDRVYRLPSPRFQPEHFAADVARIAREERADLILPTGEEAFELARRRDTLPTTLLCADFDRLVELHDKLQFLSVISTLAVPGVRVPETWPREDLPGLLADRDVVVKGRSSRFGSDVRVLARGTPPPTVRADQICQERVSGDELCALAFARNGRVQAFVAYRPAARFPLGPSFCYQPVEVPSLRALTEALVAQTGWDGPLALDAFVEPTGTVVPIECNPRFTGGAHLLPGLGQVLLDPDSSSFVAGPARMLAFPMALAVATQCRSVAQLAAWWSLFSSASDAVWDSNDLGPVLAQFEAIPWVWKLSRKEGIRVREAGSWLTRFDLPGG